MTGAARSPDPPRSDAMWARPDADRAGVVDDVTAADAADAPHDAVADDDGGDEFTRIFGDPAAMRTLGDASIEHRRRGLATAAGGGDTLDRRKKGSSDDVLVTLLAHPASTADQAVHGTALAASRRLRVDVAGRRTERRDLVFDASLRTILWLRRPARLRLYGSASMNVTILTLTPATARRRPSRWFVRAGYRAMERVLDQLESEVEPLRWQPHPDTSTPAHPDG